MLLRCSWFYELGLIATLAGWKRLLALLMKRMKILRRVCERRRLYFGSGFPGSLTCLSLQIFTGNQNHDTPELRSVAQVRTRYVRIYPERATAEGLGLRLELTGCDLDGEFLERSE